MRTQYNVDVNESYLIKIIDGSINMIDITDNQYILFENNGYIVKTLEE